MGTIWGHFAKIKGPLKPSLPCKYRYLTDLELRLHLAAEDIDAALEIDSSRALQRIPAAVQEVSHVRVG